jgi:hypothetical protein
MPDRRNFTSAANGRKSQGPITPEGKDRSKLNATTHGLLSQFTRVRHEDLRGFEEVTGAYLGRFQPQDGVEEGLVEEMIHANWNTRRIWAIEHTMMNQEINAQTSRDPAVCVAEAWGTLSETSKFKNLQRYEAHHANRHRRAMQTFIDLRKKVPLPPNSVEVERVTPETTNDDVTPEQPTPETPNPAPTQPEPTHDLPPMPITVNNTLQPITPDNPKKQPQRDPGSGRKVA